MAQKFPPRLGVADDPAAQQPTLHDCLAAAVAHADDAMAEVVQGLVRGTAPGPQNVAALKLPQAKQAVLALAAQQQAVCGSFRAALDHAVWHGGGKDQPVAQVVRYEDLQLFDDAQLGQSIEVARALQEVGHAVDDVLPGLDALVSTLLGWSTVQSGLNPLRPEVYVRSLQAALGEHVPDAAAREALMAPAGSLLGGQLRRLYRELVDWLQSTGVEPAQPPGGWPAQAAGRPPGKMARTLLTLDKLRKLLAGDFDAPRGPGEFLHTMPASMAMLQELRQEEALLKRLAQRPRAAVAPAPAAPEAQPASGEPAAPRIGAQLGEEVVGVLFETLQQDARLLPAYKAQLQVLAPAIGRLAVDDSRFFADRSHPARQLLEGLTQRSLGYASEADEGWGRFFETVQYAVRWIANSKVVDASTVADLFAHLQGVWAQHDTLLRERREQAARALLQVEQRNLLADKLGAGYAQAAQEREAPAFVLEFLRGPWAQAVAHAQLAGTEAADDPMGGGATADDLLWSVQAATSQRQQHARRLAQLVPGLLARLREGLARIEWPASQAQPFFDQLMGLHAAALQAAAPVAAPAAAAAPSATPAPLAEPRVEPQEALESGWVESVLPEGMAEPEPAGPLPGLRTGAWVELQVQGQWLRVQLTWSSPHGTLFMFTSPAGTAHSMSRRTLDRLRAQGLLRLVAGRNVVDEALDQVAHAALKNSLG